MDDIFLRKQEIEKKLEEERKRSEMIKGSLVKADQLTNSMVSILNQFDERLHKLEDTILPVHRNTKDLQRLQDNIEKTIVSLDHVIGYHHVAHDIESVLRQGPSRQVERYLKCMERLAQAVEFFSKNNPGSPELNTVNTLFANGKDSLEKEFQGQLNRQTKPLPPTKLLELIKLKEDSEVDMCIHLPEKSVSDLSMIAKWLSGPGNSQGFTTCYSEKRSKNLVETLEGLRDYIKGTLTNQNSKKTNISNTPKKAGTRRTRHDKRKDTGLGKPSYPPIAEEEIIEVEIEPFVNMISGCVRLFQAEYDIMQSIIPDRSKRNVFDAIISDPMDTLEQAGNLSFDQPSILVMADRMTAETLENKLYSVFTSDERLSHIIMYSNDKHAMTFVAFEKQCMTRHDHPYILNIFPAIQHLKSSLPLYQEILKGSSEINRLRLPRLIRELEATGVKVLEDFTDCVKSDPEKESNMPKDGTVHELTSNAMLFMQQLAQNANIAGAMLTSQHDMQQSPTKVKEFLSLYIRQVLGALKLNLDNKSRVYADGSLTAVFLLNNYHFILNALNRHELLALAQISTPDIEKLYLNFIEEQKVAYLKCWDKLTTNLSDDGKTTQAQPGAKLKDKDKQMVKEKFKSFNNDFDELIKTHQQWAMPNAEVKKEIRERAQQKILPDYTIMRDKFRMVQFTKNIEKYFKYTPESVKEYMEKLFDQSAL